LPDSALLTTTASYLLLASDLDRSLQRTAATPPVERERAYYLAHISTAKTIDDFLADDRLYAFAMKAFGLEDMTYAKAFMRKVLEGGIDDKESFANRLADKRYAEFAAVFDFVRFGAATTAFDAAQQGTVDRYVRQTLEENAGAQNEGVRLALYFARKADTVESAFAILADPALLRVVQTIFRIPAASSAMDIDRQAEHIEKLLNLADLKDPAAVDALLKRFTALWELDSPPAAAPTPAVLIGPPRELGIGAGVLMSLQALRLGGL
jgi:hypothetical protein